MGNTKNILVSGGARGIGRCIVRNLLEAGHKVYVFDIDEAELNHTVTSHLSKHHEVGSLESAVLDLRDPEDIRSGVSKAAGFFNNRIDVLINNGSIASPHWKDGKTMEDPSTLREWQAYMETNLTSPFLMSQACIPYMKTEPSDGHSGAPRKYGVGPCIVHVGSFRAHQSDPNQEGYAASKAGQLGLMQSMAVSLSPMGIRVNLVAPGRIKAAHESKDGDENGQGWEEQVEEKDVNGHPANRPGTPEDIVDAIMYLIDAGFVTGQDITVDGGASRVKYP